ncbi:hypothetical protein [Streptococcus pneumoniae]
MPWDDDMDLSFPKSSIYV